MKARIFSQLATIFLFQLQNSVEIRYILIFKKQFMCQQEQVYPVHICIPIHLDS